MKRAVLFALFIAYVLLILCAVFRGAYMGAFTNFLTLALLASVYMVAKRKDAYVPVLSVAAVLFAASMASTYVGLPLDNTVAGMDKIFHAVAGAVLAWFMLVYLSPKTKGLQLYLFALCFAVAVGAWWEVYEWLFHMYGTNISLVFTDTILDIVADTLGAAAVCFVFWLKK